MKFTSFNNTQPARAVVDIETGTANLYTGMSPETATEMQIERYRQMTGEERLRLGFELFEFACSITREGIRSQNPEADEAEVNRLLRERLALARTL